jgi:hypothetical protein
MDRAADALATVLTNSAVLRALVMAVPVAITVSFFAGWREKVENALGPAIWGTLLCLLIVLPLDFTYPELDQLRWIVVILGWCWLVSSWARHVLGEWPAPIWAHWIVCTLLLALPVATTIALIRL